MANRQRTILGLLLLGALLCAVSASVAQTQTPYRIQVDSNMARKPIHAESSLVLVPVFVYDKVKMGQYSSEDRNCLLANEVAFSALLPSQAYVPSQCHSSEVRTLTEKDFRIFQDDVQQQIQRVATGNYMIVVRDNLPKHREQSFTPMGIWSSTDLGGFARADIRPDFYSLAYAPSVSEPGCHQVRVLVDEPGTVVFARDQYCTGQSLSDPLFGTDYSARMEGELASVKRGKIPLFMQAGWFYGGKGTIQLRVVLDFPWKTLNHRWDLSDWTFWARVGVLGIIYTKDGIPMIRFSDLMYPPYWPTFVWGRNSEYPPSLVALNPGMQDGMGDMLTAKDPLWLATRYETHIEVDPGEYDLNVVLSDEEKFGRARIPLTIEPYDGKQLAISSVMLCKRYRDAHVAAVERAAANFAPQYVPLVSKGIEVTPTGDTRFKKGEPLIPYFEIYEPLLATGAPGGADVRLSTSAAGEAGLDVGATLAVARSGQAQGLPLRADRRPQTTGSAPPLVTAQAHIRILDVKTGAVVKDLAPIDAAPYMNPGSTTIPIAREVPYEQLPKGAYRMEVQATDSAGRSTAVRAAEFTVE